MLIRSRCEYVLLITVSAAILTVAGKCTVTVNGIPASPVKYNGIDDDTSYYYQTVYMFRETLHIIFNNSIDTWRDNKVQRFEFKSNTSLLNFCDGNSESICQLTYDYTLPYKLTYNDRESHYRDSLIVTSEARTVCLLDIFGEKDKVPIQFEYSWLNHSSAYELEVTITAGFPGPMDISVSCGDIPLTNLSNGGVLIQAHDLAKYGTADCEVTVISRSPSLHSLIKKINGPYYVQPSPIPKVESTTLDHLLPYLIVVGIVLVVVIVTFVFILVCCKKTCFQHIINIKNHIVTESRQHEDPVPKNSPDMECSSVYSDGSLETDGPCQSRGRSQELSLSQDPPQSSQLCSVVVHPVEASVGNSQEKFNTLDELTTV